MRLSPRRSTASNTRCRSLIRSVAHTIEGEKVRRRLLVGVGASGRGVDGATATDEDGKNGNGRRIIVRNRRHANSMMDMPRDNNHINVIDVSCNRYHIILINGIHTIIVINGRCHNNMDRAFIGEATHQANICK
jgi:hypothetical protein